MWAHLTPIDALIAPNSAPQQSHYSPTTNSQSKIPSKLRDSSTASFLDRSSASSRSSSPEGIYVATPASSFSGQSPHLAAGAIGNGGNSRGRPLGTGPPRRPSPPRPLAIHPPHFGLGESQIWHFCLSLAKFVVSQTWKKGRKRVHRRIRRTVPKWISFLLFIPTYSQSILDCVHSISTTIT